MPRRPAEISIERENLPDPVAAADAMLPLFLALLDGRGAMRPEGAELSTREARRDLSPQLKGSL